MVYSACLPQSRRSLVITRGTYLAAAVAYQQQSVVSYEAISQHSVVLCTSNPAQPLSHEWLEFQGSPWALHSQCWMFLCPKMMIWARTSLKATDHPADSSMNSTQADDAGCQPISDFEQPVGCAEDMNGASPLQFFQQMVTTEMLEQIVEHYGKYQSPPHSRAHSWSRASFNTAELKKFVAIQLLWASSATPS